jgi:hypothetical protein
MSPAVFLEPEEGCRLDVSARWPSAVCDAGDIGFVHVAKKVKVKPAREQDHAV